jgi:hypothetical protein
VHYNNESRENISELNEIILLTSRGGEEDTSNLLICLIRSNEATTTARGYQRTIGHCSSPIVVR